MRPHRASGYGCSELPPPAVLHEPLCFNYKVVDCHGSPLSGPATVFQASAGMTVVADVCGEAPPQATPQLTDAHASPRACLPPAWRQALSTVELAQPAGTRHRHPTAHACIVQVSFDGPTALVHAYSVGEHGVLRPLDHVAMLRGGPWSWSPCCRLARTFLSWCYCLVILSPLCRAYWGAVVARVCGARGLQAASAFDGGAAPSAASRPAAPPTDLKG